MSKEEQQPQPREGTPVVFKKYIEAKVNLSITELKLKKTGILAKLTIEVPVLLAYASPGMVDRTYVPGAVIST